MKSNGAAPNNSMEGPPTGRLSWEAFGLRMDYVRVKGTDLWLSRVPISRNLYRIATPAATSGGTQAATGISWTEAVRLCKWMNEQWAAHLPQGFFFRLPTTAEWLACVTGQPVGEPPWGEICPDFGDPALFTRVQAQGHPLPVAALTGQRIRERGLWQWTGDLYDPNANLRILRMACWYGTLDGHPQFLYHRTPHPDQGHPRVVFRVVAAPG